MPILNPRRVLNRAARELILEHLKTEAGEGPFSAPNAFLVTAVTVDPITSALSDIVAATAGMGGSTPISDWSGPALTDTGKVAIISGLGEWTSAGFTDPFTIIGIVLSTTSLAAGVLCFLEFDEPLEISENGQVVFVAIEAGFDGQSLYVTPRVLPFGD